LIIVPAGDAHLESKASALACRFKAEALNSSRLSGTLTKVRAADLTGRFKIHRARS